jgi:hypothetical protein
MTEEQWRTYRPLTRDQMLARALVVLDGPFDDNTDDPGAGEPTPRCGVLARIRGLIGRWR